MKTEERKIIFYDGDCGFCNRSVQFVLNKEKSPLIHFAALQSDFAQQFFQDRGFPKPNLSTFYFWDNKLYDKSSGALRVLRYLRFPFPLAQFFWIVPTFIRNGVYDFIAKRRHRLAGNFCALPTPQQRERFIS